MNKDNELINHYVLKGSALYVYNREGRLVFHEEVPDENERNYYGSNPLARTDSNGTVYERKKTNIEKVYLDGRREVFFVGYKSYRDEILVAVVAIILLGGVCVWKKNLFPEETVAKMRDQFLTNK